MTRATHGVGSSEQAPAPPPAERSTTIGRDAPGAVIITGDGNTVVQQPPATPNKPDPNRHRMLAEVRRIWIDGYLEHSLHHLTRLELGLAETPDAVSRPWD